MDHPLRRALVLALIYGALGALWIIGSDFVVERLATEPREVPGAQTWKGILFVGATGLLFFLVLHRELKRSAAIREDVQFQSRIMDEITDAVVAVDPGGRVMLWNRAAGDLFGWRRDEVGQAELARFMPPPLRSWPGTEMVDFPVGARWRGEFLATVKDGSDVPVYAVSSPIQGPDGAVRGVLVVATDISAEKAAERALEEGEARYRALIEGSSDITTILDRDGVCRYVSPAFERILGRPVEDPLHRSILEATVVHDDDREAVARAFAEVREDPGGRVTVEARVRDADDRWIPMEHRARNHLDNPAIRGIVVHSRDVSTQRRLEQQLLQAQKMEAVGRLAGGVAHDFNNIVTGIMGHAQFLMTDLPEDSSAHADAREIHGAAKRAGGLTRQLLAFSRQQIMRLEVLDLNEIVLGLRGMLERLLEETIDLEADLADGLGRVRMDGGQMEQVIMNLVVNARDAMSDRGTVTLRTRDVRLTEEDTRRFPFAMPAGDYVTLAVEDTGTGIPPEIRDRIFEPFFTTKEVGRGTGLGLSTVYGIVKQSGGFVWVDSREDRGSVFTVYLPRVEGTGPRREAARPAEARTGTETVLVVEDDAAIRRVVVRTLERWGHRVLEAADGVEGLEVLGGPVPVELVIVDLVMPRLGGREMAERAVADGFEGKILYMSGYASDPGTRASLVSRGTHFIQKPFTPHDLARRIRALLDGGEEPPGGGADGTRDGGGAGGPERDPATSPTSSSPGG